jgi:hypothetical protein
MGLTSYRKTAYFSALFRNLISSKWHGFAALSHTNLHTRERSRAGVAAESRTFRVVIFDRNNLVLEASPPFAPPPRPCSARRPELILLLAGDLPALRHILRGIAPSNLITVEGFPQAVPDHGIDRLRVAHLDAVAPMDAVRRLTDALLTAGDHDRRIAVADRW